MGKQKSNPNKFKKKAFKNQKKSFGRERIQEKPETMTIEEINLDYSKKVIGFSGIVDRIAQTGGPTIFSVTDGTATLALKGF